MRAGDLLPATAPIASPSVRLERATRVARRALDLDSARAIRHIIAVAGVSRATAKAALRKAAEELD